MAPTPSNSFSEREQKLLGMVMLSLKGGPPEVDFEKLSTISGMTVGSSRNAWRALRLKIFDGTGNAATESSPASGGRGSLAGKATPRPRKRKNQDDSPSVSKKRMSMLASTGGEAKKEDTDAEEGALVKRNRTSIADLRAEYLGDTKVEGDSDNEDEDFHRAAYYDGDELD